MKHYGPFHMLMQKIAVTRPGSLYFSLTQHYLDLFGFRTISRKHTATKVMAGLPIVMVTLRGAKTGKMRTIPLVYVRAEGETEQFAVVASNWGRVPYPAWCFNLNANPQVECTIDGVAGRYIAHEAREDEYERYRDAALNTYIGFPKYYEQLADHRSIPIHVMRPID